MRISYIEQSGCFHLADKVYKSYEPELHCRVEDIKKALKLLEGKRHIWSESDNAYLVVKWSDIKQIMGEELMPGDEE